MTHTVSSIRTPKDLRVDPAIPDGQHHGRFDLLNLVFAVDDCVATGDGRFLVLDPTAVKYQTHLRAMLEAVRYPGIANVIKIAQSPCALAVWRTPGPSAMRPPAGISRSPLSVVSVRHPRMVWMLTGPAT